MLIAPIGLHSPRNPEVRQQPRRARGGGRVLQRAQPLQHVLQPHLRADCSMRSVPLLKAH